MTIEPFWVIDYGEPFMFKGLLYIKYNWTIASESFGTTERVFNMTELVEKVTTGVGRV